MRLPRIPTLMVAVMVPVMVWLGIWQLQRAEWKDNLLVQLSAAAALPAVDLDSRRDSLPPPTGLDFRKVRVTCTASPGPARPIGGQNRSGVSGYAYRVACRDDLTAVAGWSKRHDAALPPGPLGMVTGTFMDAPGERLIYLDRAPAPLDTVAPPSVETIPNNHTAYAVQWFLFAATMLAVYAVYVRRLPR